MAMDPRQAIVLAEAIRDLYGRAELDVLTRVARRLGRGIDQPGWAEAKAAELGALRAELERTVAHLGAEGPEQLGPLLEQAHRAGVTAAADTLGATAMVATNHAGVDALVEATALRLRQTHLPILRTATDVYRAAIAEASGLGVAGAQTRRETAWRAMDRFAQRGVTGFVDSAGRNWDLASYTEMATRTAIGQAHVEGHLNELRNHGHDLVRVSDSPDECALCRPFEGRIFSLGGASARYPAFSEARDGGLFHPGCTHTVAPYIPGLSQSYRRTADPIGAEERATQRANERTIRTWKRRAAVADAMGDARGATRANAKVREWQARQRAFIDETGRRRDYRREAASGAR